MSHVCPRAGASLYSWLLSAFGLPSESVVWVTFIVIPFVSGPVPVGCRAFGLPRATRGCSRL